MANSLWKNMGLQAVMLEINVGYNCEVFRSLAKEFEICGFHGTHKIFSMSSVI